MFTVIRLLISAATIGLLISSFEQSQKSGVEFEIRSFKKVYITKDEIDVDVKNNTSSSIWCAIGQESYDGKRWIEYIMDVRRPFDKVVTFKLVKRHERLQIHIKLKNLDATISKVNEGKRMSVPLRLVLKYDQNMDGSIRAYSQVYKVIY